MKKGGQEKDLKGGETRGQKRWGRRMTTEEMKRE